jgi:hypothetical protein
MRMAVRFSTNEKSFVVDSHFFSNTCVQIANAPLT